MSRVIKFRAWDKDKKQMREVRAIEWDAQGGVDVDYVSDAMSHFAGGIDTLMQFTGLHDKNGKEIYEGDIMRHVPDGNATHLPFVVVWSDVLVAWSIHNEPRTWCEYLNERKYDYVVIGNIYENANLLV
jgi:uncharacterized phage protein (TIGR01671 family)